VPIAKTERQKQASVMKAAREKRVRDLSMTWNEGRKPWRALDSNDCDAEFYNGGFFSDSGIPDSSQVPLDDGSGYEDGLDLLDIIEVFASKMR
tara:strand:+ start:802 stop:1080 length:279 start_codon:yes stop_codon:yes gene_type:complete